MRIPRSNEGNGDSGTDSEDSNDDDSESSDDDDDDDDDCTMQNEVKQPLRFRKTIFVPCDASHKDARHRCSGKWINVTPGYILVFLGILMYRGATKV